MKMKKNLKKGMTLIETIVAFAIIAVIVVVALQGFNVIGGVNVKSQQLNKADESLELSISANDFVDENPEVLILEVDGEEISVDGRILTFVEDATDRSVRIFRYGE